MWSLSSIPIIPLFFALSALATAEATPWEMYMESPTPAHAAQVAARTYRTDPSENAREMDLGLLGVQVQAGDREAIRLAFRLLPRSDGSEAELLCVILGRLIRSQPELFLVELKAAQLPLE